MRADYHGIYDAPKAKLGILPVVGSQLETDIVSYLGKLSSAIEEGERLPNWLDVSLKPTSQGVRTFRLG